MNNSIMDELAEQARSLLPSAQHRLIVYGSSAFELSQGRDIDLLAIVPIGGEGAFHSMRPAGSKIICNLYVVPESVFAADVNLLLSGGFYAHKVALSFRELGSAGKVIDPAKSFWKIARMRAEQELGHPQDPDALTRWVHRDILDQRPTVLRTLSKFAGSPDRIAALRTWIQQLDAEADPGLGYLQPSPQEYAGAKEKALWRFWREYNKHKSGIGAWSDRTFAKMGLSLCIDGAAIVRDYLA